ncbi:radical SAM family heme chaperone HemW [Bacillaceae bacterium W0354]
MDHSVYIHIPFCHEICHYCDFAKMYYNEKLADDYLKALHDEMKLYLEHKKIKPKTVYIGGGTPTSLTPTQLETLLKTIHKFVEIDTVEEFTIEANPGEFYEGHVKTMKEYGINRISLGVQVLDDQYLKQLNRHHTINDVNRSVKLLQTYDLNNISMDFIYALPEQTISHFKQTITDALAYDLPHYSSYALQIEPRTVFYIRHQQGKLTKAKEEDEANMYLSLIDMMERHGKKHYEISNFSERGFESKHNLTYWSNEPYYAFGAGAHGYLNDERYVNFRPVNHYIKAVNDNNKPILHRDIISLKEKVEEEMFLGLRKMEGVSDLDFKQKYSFSYRDLYQKDIQRLTDNKLLVDDFDRIALTKKGMLFGNDVFSSFLIEEDDLNRVLEIDSSH